MSEDAFFSSPEARTLKEPDLLRRILSVIPLNSDMLYELTFHASFAKKISEVMRREGKGIQGYERMQQSFFEAVEKIRLLLEEVENDFGVTTSDILSGTREANARLSYVLEDLALYKDWNLQE
jgi:hypothetical protein